MKRISLLQTKNILQNHLNLRVKGHFFILCLILNTNHPILNSDHLYRFINSDDETTKAMLVSLISSMILHVLFAALHHLHLNTKFYFGNIICNKDLFVVIFVKALREKIFRSIRTNSVPNRVRICWILSFDYELKENYIT